MNWETGTEPYDLLSGSVERINRGHYAVKSQSGGGCHDVWTRSRPWVCTCPDYTFHRHMAWYVCKRMVAVCMAGEAEFAPSIEPERACDTILPEIDVRRCVHCGLFETVGHGVRPNKNYTVRRRLCKSCGKTYSCNVGFEGLSHCPETVTEAINMYNNGWVLLRGNVLAWRKGHRRIAPDHSKMGGTSGRKCARIRIRPARKGGKGVEDRRNARQNQGRGELPVLHHTTTGPGSGSTIWRHPTRAQTMSGRCLQKRRIWQVSIQSFSYRTGPQTLQRRPDWNTAMPRTYGTPTCGETATTRWKGSSAASNPREKTMRSLKRPDSDIVWSIPIHYNFVRKHMGLGLKTPAHAAGIMVRGVNKWKTLIQNAAMAKHSAMWPVHAS